MIALIFFEVAFPAAPTDSVEKRRLTSQKPLGKPYSRKRDKSAKTRPTTGLVRVANPNQTREACTMKFRPLHDRVVVRRVEEDAKTAGGIIIPDTAKEKPQQGEVIAVGPGARDEQGEVQPLDVKAGDRVLFGKWSGTEVKIDGEDLLIMKESDIMGVLEGKAKVHAAA